MDRIESVAEALYLLRFAKFKPKVTWTMCKADKPDIAAIYMENATVAVQAYEKRLTESGNRSH